eukprot:TRINITY_DN7519_c0_g1_i1.p1 TRINITY_DN7519_c0_g1~~TRINITY_DN7519_c0_g1_i1.p1  ORF type:complete len:233 (-),score=46.53 TRINITY_DN7519_c0_g1_i1:13-711(-)
MLEMQKDKNANIRRKAMAAAGEYLFYAATQMDDEAAESVWDISPSTVTAIVNCIKPGEDEIVKFYACKTIENITSQSVSAGYRFSTIEAASLLVNIIQNTKNDNLRVSASVAVSHICKHNKNVFQNFFDLLGFGNFAAAMGDSHVRIQQAFITLLLFALKNSYSLVERYYIAQLSSDQLLPALATLIQNNNPVIKGKCILTIVLLMQNHFSWMPILGGTGFYQHIDLSLIHI